MKQKLVFITAGGNDVGMGHVYRTLTLAGELLTAADISFIVNQDEIVIDLIKKSGYPVFSGENEDKTRNILKRLQPAVVVIDRRQVVEELSKYIKNNLDSRLVLFESASAANDSASVVVNAVLGGWDTNGKYLNPQTQTLYFCGPKYWILRPEFYEFTRKSEKSSHKINRIVLVFGGSDPANLSSKALSELLKLDKDLQIDLCMGVHFTYFNEIKELIDKYPDKAGNINLYHNSKNIAELMHRSDLVITSPGTSAIEALFLGIPIIAVNQNYQQSEDFRGYIDTISENKLSDIKEIIERSLFISPFQKDIRESEIGEGKRDVIQAIKDLIERK